MSDLHESFEQGCVDAEARGCTVLVAEPNQLFIDLDSQEAVDHFDAMLLDWNQHTGSHYLVIDDRYYSSSGAPKQHVVLRFANDGPRLTVPEQIALQASLGSDRKKEMLTLLRLWTGIDLPIRLFKPKDAVQIQEKVRTPFTDLTPLTEPIDFPF